MNEADILRIAEESKNRIPTNEPRKFKFVQHFPGWMYYEPKTIEFTKIEELLEFDDVKWWEKQPGFYGYFVQVCNYRNLDEHKLFLMALCICGEIFNLNIFANRMLAHLK